MKNIIIYSMLLMLLFAACTEKEKITIGETTSPVLSSGLSGSDVVITEDVLEDVCCTFSWNAADFGFESADSEYTLWINTAGGDVADATVMGTTTELSIGFTYEEMNQKILAMGGTPDEPFAVEFMLTSNLADQLNTESNSVTLNITPVEVVIEYPKLYIAGNFTPGWDFAEDIAIFSVNRDDVYEGYINMDTGTEWPAFQFSLEVGWVEASVVNDPDASGTSGTLQVGVWGNNINVADGAGYYRVKANLNNLTYSVAKTDWGISGDFNGWGNTPMTYDDATDTWSYTGDVTAGGFKFIANGEWNIYYGGNAIVGALEVPGENIPIAADGNYTITLNLGEAIYSYSIVQN